MSKSVEVVFIALAAVVLLGLARLVLERIHGSPLRDLLTQRDNPAVGIAVAGYLFAVIWTVTVLLGTPSRGFVADLLGVLLYGGLGILLLTAVALGSCGLFICSPAELRQHLAAHNVAVAVVLSGVYIATSLIYSGALSGEGGGFWLLIIFFLLGQLALIGITRVFRWLTSYDDVQEIAAGNVAAAFALTGVLIGVGLIVGRAVSGQYTGFVSSFGHFLRALLLAAAFYPVRQLVVQGLVLGGPMGWRATLLDSEIGQDKNVAAGVLEATAYVATGLFLTTIV